MKAQFLLALDLSGRCKCARLAILREAVFLAGCSCACFVSFFRVCTPFTKRGLNFEGPSPRQQRSDVVVQLDDHAVSKMKAVFCVLALVKNKKEQRTFFMPDRGWTTLVLPQLIAPRQSSR